MSKREKQMYDRVHIPARNNKYLMKTRAILTLVGPWKVNLITLDELCYPSGRLYPVIAIFSLMNKGPFNKKGHKMAE